VEPIKEIGIPNITIPQVKQSDWVYGIPFIPNNNPPVTLQIGFPIVDMPGCVTMHKDNKNHITGLPFDHDLVNQDEKGSTTLCPHGEYPTYDAMDYQPEQLLITRETPPPPVAPPPTPPEFTPDAIPDTKKEVPCPGPGQLRVGDLTQAGDEKVTGHELSADGKTCVTLYEDTTPAEKFLPSVNQSTTTVAIAVLATAGAAATPLLLRIIKPIIKKITDTVKKKLGKGKKKEEQTSEQIAKKYKMKKLVITD
tara:strand:+ start:134 stop:889 length:756 start_codon:yes stop_codon:yes gene_type:complete